MSQIRQYLNQIRILFRTNVLRFNFYRIHLLYFIITIVITAAVFHGANTDGYRVTYSDSLTLCASAMTNTGLNPVNLNSLNVFQQSILFVLMALGDLSIVTVSVVYIRRFYFARNMKNFIEHSRTGRQIARDLERDGNSSSASLSEPSAASLASQSSHVSEQKSADALRMRKRQHKQDERSFDDRRNMFSHHSGYGGFPFPWETESFKTFTKSIFRKDKTNTVSSAPDHFYISFNPDIDARGRFHNLSKEEEKELGGVEYRALGLLQWLLPAYSLVWLGLGWVILLPYSSRSDISTTIRSSQSGNLRSEWWAFFAILSGYSNCGLNLLNSNMMRRCMSAEV
jgi:hypothetical protein